MFVVSQLLCWPYHWWSTLGFCRRFIPDTELVDLSCWSESDEFAPNLKTSVKFVMTTCPITIYWDRPSKLCWQLFHTRFRWTGLDLSTNVNAESCSDLFCFARVSLFMETFESSRVIAEIIKFCFHMGLWDNIQVIDNQALERKPVIEQNWPDRNTWWASTTCRGFFVVDANPEYARVLCISVLNMINFHIDPSWSEIAKKFWIWGCCKAFVNSNRNRILIQVWNHWHPRACIYAECTQ